MRTLLRLLFVVTFGLFAISGFSQAPEAVNYQAVARDGSGTPLVNQSVNVQFEIRQGTSAGTAVYVETHSLTTNPYGLFTAELGRGSTALGVFSGISWGTDNFYLHVTVNGDAMPSATQLLSVPYALYAKESGNGPQGAPGKNTLMNSTLEAVGVNCANGGQFIETGLDANENGVLDAAEVQVSYYICNGTDGVDGVDGINGQDGVDGQDGTGVNWLGTLTNEPTSASVNDAYYNSTDGVSYIYDGTNWTTLAQDGVDGNDGVDGQDGESVNWLGTLTSDPVSANTNDAYYNSTDGAAYIYDGVSWNILAQDGNDGVNGTSYFAGNGITISNDSIINMGDLDNDASNELQVLSIVNDTIYLDNGGGQVGLPPVLGDNWGNDTVTTLGSNILGNGTSASPLQVIDNDTSASNELQVLSIINDTIYLNNGGGQVGLPPVSGDNWGNDTVTTFGANILGNGTSASPLQVIDNDTSASNELQVLSIVNDTIYLNNGGGQVGLPSSGDSDWEVAGDTLYPTSLSSYVGVGTSSPVAQLSVESNDTIMAAFIGNEPNISAIQIHANQTGAMAGLLLSADNQMSTFSMDPVNQELGLNYQNVGGKISLLADQGIVAFTDTTYGQIVHVGSSMFNQIDTIRNAGNAGNMVFHENYGTFLTDSLYVFGANTSQTGWVLANSGNGKAQWADPNGLIGGATPWVQNGNYVYSSNTGDSIGIGTNTPAAKFHVADGGATNSTVALFEKGGFFGASIDINSTNSVSSGINFLNGGTNTAGIYSTTSNVLGVSSQFVSIGSNNANAKLLISDASSVSKPTLQVHESTTGYSRIKHTNTVGGKYWMIEAGLNAADAFSGYSIGYFDGSNSIIPFVVYGDNKVGVNNLNAPLGVFHVMDNNGSFSMFEGMSQPGEIRVGRSNQPSFTRQAVLGGEGIGTINFPGAVGTTFGNGPQISAIATENFSGSSNGSELIFRTIPNATATQQDALRLLNDGTTEVPVNLRVLNGAGNAGYVLADDGLGNAIWTNPTTLGATSLWTDASPDIYYTGGKVGIGTTTPQTDLHIANNNMAILAIQTSSSVDGSTLALTRTGGSVGFETGIAASDRIGAVTFTGHNTVGFVDGAQMVSQATEAWGSTNNGANIIFKTTENGFSALQDRMIIDHNGNIAIGSNSPTEKLHIQGGTLRVDDGTRPYNLPFQDGSAAGEVLTTDGAGNTYWGAPSASPWIYNSTNIFFKGGNVAVGTEVPSALFHIQDSLASAGTELFNIESNIGSDIVMVNNDGIASFLGDVGIGTISPSALLDVNGTFKLTDGTQGQDKELVSDATGNTTWKERAIAFESFAANPQTIGNDPFGSPTNLVAFDQVILDDGIGYDGSVGVHQYTAPVSGVYMIEVNISFFYGAPGPDDTIKVGLMKNGGGTPIKVSSTNIKTNEESSISFACTVRLATGDKLFVEANTKNLGNGDNINLIQGENNWFSGHLVYAY